MLSMRCGICRFRQIGHLGTLDPLATVFLCCCWGRATRLVQFYSVAP